MGKHEAEVDPDDELLPELPKRMSPEEEEAEADQHLANEPAPYVDGKEDGADLD